MVFLYPITSSVCPASVLPLDLLLLLILTISGSVFKLPLVLSLAFSKSADLFIHTFLELHYWTLTLEVSQTSTLITGVSSLIPSSSRIPTILGHVVNLLAIPELYSTLPIVISFPLSLVVSILCYLAFFLDGDRIFVSTAEGSAEARCSSSSSSSSSFSTSSSSLSSSDDSLS
ncbi:hypothetical protein Tco_0820109 [Tanacetum coccineum]|uniref:Uncharacterized protein n=1 Tax=Tanacetum coccineum TaxID=301880 RepID=A0ABQ5A8F7_9ASTR